MAKSPSHGWEMGGLYLIFWLRNYPHATGTRPGVEVRATFDDHCSLISLIVLHIDNFCGGLRTFVSSDPEAAGVADAMIKARECLRFLGKCPITSQ